MEDNPQELIELFLYDGTIDGVIEIELDSYNIKGVKIPRKRFEKYGKHKINKEGVYFLIIENTDTNEDEIYIGEANDVFERNQNRLKDVKDKNNEWKTMIVFMRKNLDASRRYYAERELTLKAKECNRFKIRNRHRKDEIKESYKSGMDQFIKHVHTILNILGYEVLEKPYDEDKNTKRWFLNMTKNKVEEISAIGIYNEETTKMTVLKNSIISKEHNETLNPKVKIKREEALSNIDNEGKLKNDVLCDSPSEAAKFVIGYEAGPIRWKDENDSTLKDYIDEINKGISLDEK